MLSDDGPAGWPHRLAVAALAALGGCIAAYLAMYQLGLLPGVWDPVFGPASSQAVLTSPLSRSLPIPDALLGAAAYVCEVCLAMLGGRDRWLVHPRLVLAYGVVLAGLALSSLGLVLVQVLVLRSACTLCLTSAGISFVNAGLGRREVLAALSVGMRSGRQLKSTCGGTRLYAEDPES
jgi:uncharacterized membrane protein